jgi:pilus assembly protein CpaF
MSTIHANSARDALSRLEMLAGFAGFQGSEDSLRRQIASAIDFVIQISRLSNGQRVVSSVTEVTGLTDKIITTQEMFHHETFIDPSGSERNRWPALGFHPHTRKLEPFRDFLRRATLEICV